MLECNGITRLGSGAVCMQSVRYPERKPRPLSLRWFVYSASISVKWKITMTRVFFNQLGLTTAFTLKSFWNEYALFKIRTHFNCRQLLHSIIF